jgi:hypothetical protein
MTKEEAKIVFLNRGYVEVEGGTIYDADKWRESCRVISEWLEQEPTTVIATGDGAYYKIKACEDAISRQGDDRWLIHFGQNMAIPSADPYKGMTNGQVHDMLYQMLVELKDGADRYGAEYWWNSPYKGEQE